MRCKTPKMRRVANGLTTSKLLSHLIKGNQFSNNPMRKISNPRLRIFVSAADWLISCSLGITNAMALPTAKRKNGKTRSVGVQPSQGACFNGPYICPQSPGLFTRIMRQTVAPRKISRAWKRGCVGSDCKAVNVNR